MPPEAPATAVARRARLGPAAFAVFTVALLLSLAAVLIFDHSSAHTSVFTLSNFVGPTADTLLHGQGLVVCSDGMGTVGNPICFHAARMPLASAVVALGAGLFGDRYLLIGLFKAVLLLLPLFGAMLLVLRCLPSAPIPRGLTLALLLLPFFLTPFLADVVNLQVEEGYSYSLIALTFALVLFPVDCMHSARLDGQTRSRRDSSPRSWPQILLFCFCSALLYLSKSSMAPAVAVLAACFLLPIRRDFPRVACTVILLALAPAGWGAWQHHSSGRFALGTSLDGENLQKGNNPEFLAHYPPPAGDNLDRYDGDLNRGVVFHNEWTFNDFHEKAAIAFMRTNPAATLRGDLRKLNIIFLSLHKVGSQPGVGIMAVVETAALVLFRLLFWTALALALRSLARPPHRAAAIAFLLLVATVSLPYVLGFAYTRHVSVLIYPAALFLCTLLVRAPDLAQTA